MTDFEAYQEYIQRKHNAFCKAVIRYAARDKMKSSGRLVGIVRNENHRQLLERYGVPVFLFVNKMDLAGADRAAVLAELRRRSAPAAAPQKKRARKYEALPGGLSEGQQKKVWYLMYQLEKYDPAPEGVQLRDRLCGLISRQFGVTAFPTQPFRFLSFSQGNALIEGLKSLAERKELEYLHSDRYRREREAAGK